MTEAQRGPVGLKLTIGKEQVIIPPDIHINQAMADAINLVHGLMLSIARLEAATTYSQVVKEKEVIGGYARSVHVINTSDSIPTGLKQVLRIDDKLEIARKKLGGNYDR